MQRCRSNLRPPGSGLGVERATIAKRSGLCAGSDFDGYRGGSEDLTGSVHIPIVLAGYPRDTQFNHAGGKRGPTKVDAKDAPAPMPRMRVAGLLRRFGDVIILQRFHP